MLCNGVEHGTVVCRKVGGHHGASRGIGHAIALAFAQAGAQVGICARNTDGLLVGAAAIEPHAKVYAETCDVGDESSLASFISGAAEALGGIDVLINNASGGGNGDDADAWHAWINVDLLGTVRATQLAVPFLEQSGSGAIVNISSIRGLTRSARLPAYSAVKAAIINYSISQALAPADRGIRVNAIRG